jgi:hypothetical protein
MAWFSSDFLKSRYVCVNRFDAIIASTSKSWSNQLALLQFWLCQSVQELPLWKRLVATQYTSQPKALAELIEKAAQAAHK